MRRRSLQKLFFIITTLSVVGIYFKMPIIARKTIPSSRDMQSDHERHGQTNRSGDEYDIKYYLKHNLNEQCNQKFKQSHYLLIDFLPGRIGNALFQVYCGLALGLQMCYRVVVEPQNKYFVEGIDYFFDLKGIFKIDNLDKQSFRHFKVGPLNEGSGSLLMKMGTNLTLNSRCRNTIFADGYGDFIRSSVRFKDYISKLVSDYLGLLPNNRSFVAIHVRRTDKVGIYNYTYGNLEWYKPYIDRAMNYLKMRYKHLSFIFVTDDKQWCQENFHGDNIYFSPFWSPGLDLALMTKGDHVILTVGTFGWHGAWLGQAKTVIYQSKCVWKEFTKREDFFLPNWVDLGKTNVECPESVDEDFGSS